ncbi:MAG: oligosaccharide repeat unit polymerase, partial [Muribaculaceae bacterium]|nr:oligosaccharide repeat unit polymerase [Muribaculaceae bacterium]
YYIITNLIVFFCAVSFDIFYRLSYNSIKGPANFKSKYLISAETPEPSKYSKIILLLSFLCVAITLYIYKSQPILLVFRGVDGLELEDNTIASSQFLGPLFNCIIRPIPIICLINYMCIGKKKHIKILLFFLALIACFPTSLARLRVAAYYLPILIILFPNLRYHNRFVNFFIFGFLLVFPLLNNFRYFGKDGFRWFDIDFTMFCNMNYDSYQSFAFVLQNNIITYGKQLAVVLFFWVPRSIWPDKPYFSGMTVAQDYGLWFHQISMNYFAEGYINFGIIGTFAFTIFLAYISAKFDMYYWKLNDAKIHSLYTPFFLLFIGMYFFFMRGDLMYGFEYTICLLLANLGVYKITKSIYNIR